MTSSTAPQPLHLSLPRVQISYLDARPIIETTGYSLSDPFEEVLPGNVVAVRIRLPHGVTDRYLEKTSQGWVDVNGEPVDGDIVSWRYPSADELADFEECRRERLAGCDEDSNIRSPWCFDVPWNRPAAKCGGMS